MIKMSKKNNLDEMQEQKLLHIESKGCWFAFWALLIAMVIQMLLSRENMIERLAGEWVVFMCLAIYTAGACVKAGIWDRRLKADANTNVAASLIGGGISGLIFAVVNYLEYGYLGGAIVTFVLNFLIVGILCFAVLSVVTLIYKKRLAKMEMEEEDGIVE